MSVETHHQSHVPVVYHEEPKIYTSSVRLQLQLKRNDNLYPKEFSGDKAELYEWHTIVLTPQLESINKDHQSHQNQQQSTKSGIQGHQWKMKNVGNDLKSDLDKFMLCERYHSEYQQQMQKYQQSKQQKQPKQQPTKTEEALSAKQASNDEKVTKEKEKVKEKEKDKSKKGSRFFFH